MDLRLENRVAVVTGASKGIGLAAARSLAREGANLVIAARTEVSLGESAAEIRKISGREVLTVVTNTLDDVSAQELAANAIKQFGRIDILVNSATHTDPRDPGEDISSSSDELVIAQIDDKVLGYLRVCRAVIPHMLEQRYGRIVNVGGVGARRTQSVARTLRTVGVVALTANLADELGRHGVTAVTVNPGFTRTEKTDAWITELAEDRGLSRTLIEEELSTGTAIGRVIEVEEIAALISFAASEYGAILNGDSIQASGGIPGVVHY